MQPDRLYWPAWAHFLQRWGIKEVAAALLDSAGPLTLLMAQLVYVGQPLLSSFSSTDRLQSLAHLLEDQGEAQTFAKFLREEIIS